MHLNDRRRAEGYQGRALRLPAEAQYIGIACALFVTIVAETMLQLPGAGPLPFNGLPVLLALSVIFGAGRNGLVLSVSLFLLSHAGVIIALSYIRTGSIDMIIDMGPQLLVQTVFFAVMVYYFLYLAGRKWDPSWPTQVTRFLVLLVVLAFGHGIDWLALSAVPWGTWTGFQEALIGGPHRQLHSVALLTLLLVFSPVTIYYWIRLREICGLRSWVDRDNLLPAINKSPNQFYLKLLAGGVGFYALQAITQITGGAASAYFPFYAMVIPAIWLAVTEGTKRTAAAVALAGLIWLVMAPLPGTGNDAWPFWLHHQIGLILLACVCWFSLSVVRYFEANQRLEMESQYDRVSGAVKHASFMAHGRRETARCERYGRPSTLLLVNIESYGGELGRQKRDIYDLIRRSLVLLINEHIRVQDQIGRVSKDQFAVLLTETPIQGALIVAERLVAVIRDARFRHEAQELSLRCSIGVSQIASDHATFDVSLERAAEEAELARKEGGNRVKVYVGDGTRVTT